MTVAQEVAKQLSDHLYVVAAKIDGKAKRTGHARLSAYVDDLFTMSRQLKDIADGKIGDYEAISVERDEPI